MCARHRVSRMLIGLSAFVAGIVLSAGQASAIPIKGFEMGDVAQPHKNLLLSEALDLVNKGQFDEGIRKAREALKSDPKLAPAYEVIGAAQVMKGDIDAGLASLKKAVELDPKQSSAYTKIGDVYMARQQDAEAKKQFLKAVELNPADNRAHQRLGILYDREKRVDLAITHYEKGILGTAPDYVGIKVDLGRLYNERQQFDRTVELLVKVIPPESANTTGHIVLGTAYLGLKQAEKAIEEFKIAQKLEPDTERAPLSLGIAYRENGKFKESLAELNKVVKIKPKWSTGYFQLGETHFAMKNSEAALENFRKAEQFSPNPLLVQKRMAEVHLADKQTDKAVQIYKKIIQSGRADANTYDLLGTAYQMSGRTEDAEKTFIEMTKKYPKEAFPPYRLGLFYGFVRQYDKAIAELKTALARSPEDPLVLKALSVSHNQKADRAGALSYAQKLVKVQPANLNEQFYLASLYHDERDFQKAGSIYEEILSKDPRHVPALNNLADAKAQQGRLEEAERTAAKAAGLAPENATVLDTYGWILHRRGKDKEALAILEKSAAAAPENPAVLYHLGAVYHALGKNDLAKSSLQKALRISDRFREAPDAKKLLERL